MCSKRKMPCVRSDSPVLWGKTAKTELLFSAPGSNSGEHTVICVRRILQPVLLEETRWVSDLPSNCLVASRKQSSWSDCMWSPLCALPPPLLLVLTNKVIAVGCLSPVVSIRPSSSQSDIVSCLQSEFCSIKSFQIAQAVILTTHTSCFCLWSFLQFSIFFFSPSLSNVDKSLRVLSLVTWVFLIPSLCSSLVLLYQMDAHKTTLSILLHPQPLNTFQYS